MTKTFRTPIKDMDQNQREWFATVMVSMVLADGNISQGEVQSLMDSINFLNDPDSVERLKKFIQFQTPPPLQAFPGWEGDVRRRAAILLDLIEVAVADRDFSEGEKKRFYEIGKLLGFPWKKVDELVSMGAKFMETMPETE